MGHLAGLRNLEQAIEDQVVDQFHGQLLRPK
jgi:hypothetical protein